MIKKEHLEPNDAPIEANGLVKTEPGEAGARVLPRRDVPRGGDLEQLQRAPPALRPPPQHAAQAAPPPALLQGEPDQEVSRLHVSPDTGPGGRIPSSYTCHCGGYYRSRDYW